MKRLLTILAMALASPPAVAWDELGPNGVPTGRTYNASTMFRLSSPSWDGLELLTDPEDLGFVARATADALREAGQPHPKLRSPSMFGEFGVSGLDVIETLEFVARIAEEDRGKAKQRLESPDFLMAHFDVYAWNPDAEGAAKRGTTIAAGQIRLTRYLVFSVPGRPRKMGDFDTALYAVPDDELTGAPGDRYKYTRMAVYDGVYEKGGEAEGHARPLVWLTREGSNQALMQGTIEITFPTGETQMYNVHRNNGIAYNPRMKDQNRQARYWYFQHVDHIRGTEEIPLRPTATVAGDIYNVGLGKLVALRTPAGIRLAVLADTGGAFQPNLFQLDYLSGTFPDKATFAAATKNIPQRVPAAVLLKKP